MSIAIELSTASASLVTQKEVYCYCSAGREANQLCGNAVLGPWTSQVAQWYKESDCQCRKHERRSFNPWVKKIPWRMDWWPTPVFLPGESHRQRSLVGYSPWGRKSRTRLSALSLRGLKLAVKHKNYRFFLIKVYNFWIKCILILIILIKDHFNQNV